MVSVPNFTTVPPLNRKSCQATSKSYRFVCDNSGTIQIIKIVPPEPKGAFFMSAYPPTLFLLLNPPQPKSVSKKKLTLWFCQSFKPSTQGGKT